MLHVSVTVPAAAAGSFTLAGYIRKDGATPQLTQACAKLGGAGASDMLTVSLMVPAGWQYQVDAVNAGAINSWIEF